jgi:DNA-binding transcriptional LysR family regulator
MLGTSDWSVLSISQGLCDLCFFEGSIPQLPAHAEKIADDEMVLVAASTHPLARKKSVTADDLLESMFIMPESGSSMRDLTEKYLASLGVSPNRLRISMTVNDPALRMSLLRLGSALHSFLRGRQSGAPGGVAGGFAFRQKAIFEGVFHGSPGRDAVSAGRGLMKHVGN